MEKKPYKVTLAGDNVVLTPDNCGIQMFRNRPEMDYIDVFEIDEDTGNEKHAWYFNPLAAAFIAGFSIIKDRQKELQKAERQYGSFLKQSGWNADTRVDDSPTDFELELFAKSIIGDALDSDKKLHKDLNKALKEDFDE